MGTETLSMPEDALVNMLKALPEDTLIRIFWKIVAKFDISPLTSEEREDVRRARIELEKGETTKWKDLK